MKKVAIILALILAIAVMMSVAAPAFAACETMTYADALTLLEQDFGDPSVVPQSEEDWAAQDHMKWKRNWFDAEWNFGEYQRTLYVDSACKLVLSILCYDVIHNPQSCSYTPWLDTLREFGYENAELVDEEGNGVLRPITPEEFDDIRAWAGENLYAPVEVGEMDEEWFCEEPAEAIMPELTPAPEEVEETMEHMTALREAIAELVNAVKVSMATETMSQPAVKTLSATESIWQFQTFRVAGTLTDINADGSDGDEIPFTFLITMPR